MCRNASFSALDGPEQNYAYRELQHLSDKVATAIDHLSPVGSSIAIHADGSAEWIISIIGMIKSGSSYCPLDPQYPLSRRTAVCDAAGASAILFPSENSQKDNNPMLDRPVLVVTKVLATAPSVTASPETPQRHRATPASDAVVVFTAGTTGAPKGVPISHHGLLALQSNEEARIFSRPGRRIAQMMPPTFDYCANEVFSALLHGGTLVLRHIPRTPTRTCAPPT